MSESLSQDVVRTIVREELVAHSLPVLSGETSVSQPLADTEAEVRLLAQLLAGKATAEDLEGLGGEHFYNPLAGAFFELLASPIRGGTEFTLDTQAEAIASSGIGTSWTNLEWIERVRDSVPVQLVPRVADRVKRIRRIAAWRRFFEAAAKLETDCRIGFSRGDSLEVDGQDGPELDPHARLCRMLAHLHAELEIRLQ